MMSVLSGWPKRVPSSYPASTSPTWSSRKNAAPAAAIGAAQTKWNTVWRLPAGLLIVNGDPSADIAVLQDRANLHVIMKGGKFVECQLTPSKATAKAA